MSLTNLWYSLDRTVQKLAQEAKENIEQLGIPDDTEKRLFYFQYIEKEIAKLKDDIHDPEGQSRFKTIVKNKAALFYGTEPRDTVKSLDRACQRGGVLRASSKSEKKKKNVLYNAPSKEAEV